MVHVDEVQADGLVPDSNLAFAGFADLDIGDPELFRPAGLHDL